MSSKKKAVAMKEKAQPALVPNLRFPDFKNGRVWETSSLDSLAEFVGARVSTSKLSVSNYVSTENLLQDFAGMTNAFQLPSTNSATKFIAGDILVSNIRPYLKKVWQADRDGGASNDVVVIRPKVGSLKRYLPVVLKSDAFIAYVMKGAKGVKMPRGDVASIEKYPVTYPIEETEQQKIAECLTSLDEVIAAQARKVDALKSHKNGLIQQIFPRGNDAQPHLRFPEFQNKRQWRVRKLNELLFETKMRNRTLELGPADVLSVSGEYGCVNQIEFLGRSYAGVSVKDYHVVEHGDVVYTKSPLKRNPFGIIKENKGKRGIVSTLYAVYRPFPDCSGAYLDRFFSRDYNLNSYLQPIVKKGAKNDMKVNNADVLKGDISVPELPEQQKIAECLSSLDALIVAEFQKLEVLKRHKRGLMQQLFPTPAEAEA